jgi:hypothetical protein
MVPAMRTTDYTGAFELGEAISESISVFLLTSEEK